jgi:hypothetical protein
LPTVNTSGTLTADGTVQTVADVTDNKYFTFKLDTSAMLTSDADVTVLKIYDMVLNAGALALVFEETYTGTQTFKIKFLPPQWVTEEIKITLQQTAGVNKDYPWVLLQND